MQQEAAINIRCQKHGERIIFVKLTETGEMKCQKCQTENGVSIEELTQLLTDLRQKKIKQLIEQGKKSEKRLQSLKKLFLDIQEQFNSKINNFVKNINEQITSVNQNVSKDCELLKQPVQELSGTQIKNHIKELKQQQEMKDDERIRHDGKLRNSMIQQYIELIKLLNKQLKEGSNWKQSKEAKDIKENDEKNKFTSKEYFGIIQKQYKLCHQQQNIVPCYAIAMDLEEKILVNGRKNTIQVWDFEQDATMYLKQTLEGHTDSVHCLCFSQKELWFISGSYDHSIRIWKKKISQKWACIQILQEAHSNWVQGVLLTNDEDQFISCSGDKTIKVWMLILKQWSNVQLLNEHNSQVYYVCFNHNCSLLASTGFDDLRIWQKGKEQKWIQKQQISNQNRYQRIKFINKNELIASTQLKGSITRFTIQNGEFKVASQIQLNDRTDSECFCFPLTYNGKLATLKHEKEIYVIKYDKGDYKIRQVLKGDYRAGYLFKDGKYLILSNWDKECIEIFK